MSEGLTLIKIKRELCAKCVSVKRWKQGSEFIDSRVIETSRPVSSKESDNKATV